MKIVTAGSLAIEFDVAVVGAGAVGLVCGAKLTECGLSTIILERTSTPGSGISSRNSEVVHAGFYYPTGSLKHRFCVHGRRMLYAFLAEAGIPFRKCGKLVVATDEVELAGMERLQTRARENGVEGVRLIGAKEAREMEPELNSVGGLWSPETGVFDSHAYMMALIARIEAAGGLIAYRAPVTSAEIANGCFVLRIGGAEPTTLRVKRLVNSAGLFAPQLASRIEGLESRYVPTQRLAKGTYFGLSGRPPFRHLVYPAPVDGGLGVHATIDLGGRVRFGPDVEWLAEGTPPDGVDYAVGMERERSFVAAIRRYWPGLPDGALFPDYAGCRPKLSGPGQPAADFLVQTDAEHGIRGLVNLFGIESPGLTSSLAIGEHVCQGLCE
ncbi:MAG: NAD(P)/FAD-dependent oxidoreductase [Hyphomicrobiales bacterium]